MTFRYARHTNDLEKIKSFYINILGFDIVGSFVNHDDYDGVFIGKFDENWHLEFTHSKEIVTHSFTEDDILVFYPNNNSEYEEILEQITKKSIDFISPKNPYWNENGKMIHDPDGYKIVISNLKITE